MDESRILITGAHGQLGKALLLKYPGATTVSHSELDFADWSAAESYDWTKVAIILNAGAYTNVDGAETSDGRVAAWKANATAVANLSKIAAAHDITLVHISSDYVFDGTKDNHTEDEDLSPLGVYGQTKAAGDIAVITTPKHYVLRSTWVIGDGNNFVRTMINLASRDISPKVVNDQVGRLTFTSTIVDAIDTLLQKEAAFGVYNVTNDGESASWADITRTIFKELGRDDLTVTDTTTEEYFASKPDVSPRPKQSTMNLTKIKATGLTLRDWRIELHDYVKAEQARPKE